MRNKKETSQKSYFILSLITGLGALVVTPLLNNKLEQQKANWAVQEKLKFQELEYVRECIKDISIIKSNIAKITLEYNTVQVTYKSDTLRMGKEYASRFETYVMKSLQTNDSIMRNLAISTSNILFHSKGDTVSKLIEYLNVSLNTYHYSVLSAIDSLSCTLTQTKTDSKDKQTYLQRTDSLVTEFTTKQVLQYSPLLNVYIAKLRTYNIDSNGVKWYK